MFNTERTIHLHLLCFKYSNILISVVDADRVDSTVHDQPQKLGGLLIKPLTKCTCVTHSDTMGAFFKSYTNNS